MKGREMFRPMGPNKNELLGLMRRSKTQDEWHRNVKEVRRRCNGVLPSFWIGTFFELAREKAQKWGCQLGDLI